MGYLTDLRKKAGLTQQKLAVKLGMKAEYGQKRISMWERGDALPSDQELEELARLYKVTPEQIRDSFADPSAGSAFQLADHIASLSRPALFAICYSGAPRIMLDSMLRQKFVRAASKFLSFAMFVPYPSIREATTDSNSLLLTAFYTRVWGSVLAMREVVKAESTRRNAVGVYGPRVQDGAKQYPAPFSSRYALLLESTSDEKTFEKSLYLTIETPKSKRVDLIGTARDETVLDQINCWEAFFGPVIRTWQKELKLPTGDCGRWQYVAD